MAEQLELFGDDSGEPQPGPADGAPGPLEGSDPSPSSTAGHHTRSSSSTPDSGAPPEGYVWVTVGRDKRLTEVAAAHAERLGLTELAKEVTVSWNKRMRTAAGRAFYQTAKIELNPKLQTLPKETREQEIHQTFLHELAHLVSFARHPGTRIQPHGPEWKQACADLGIPGEDRCHDLNFQPRRQKRKFAYTCPACDSVVKRVRRLRRTVACYECCRAHSGGRFDSRFVLEERRLT